jgi:hypothetical protein
MKRFLAALVAGTMLLVGVTAMSPANASAAENAVVRWNGVAADVILADAATRSPSAAALYIAIVQGAVYNATMAIQKTHRMYRSSLSAPGTASVDAAVAAAARDVLVANFPAQQPMIDASYAAALAEIPDGTAKDDGVGVGQAAADEMVAMRANDGRFAPVPAPPDGDEPGEWRRTSVGPAVTPWAAYVVPFVVNAPDQFRPEAPNSLTSKDYAAQWDEVRRYGARTGSARTDAQTEIARFWTDNTVGQFNRAFRGFATERALGVGATARLFAMTALTGADAMITCWNTKYHHAFWRPVTAIRLADTDGNPATTADPAWEPLSTTANHPEYTSGHACLTGAVSRALATFLGTEHVDLTMDAAVPGTTEHHFATIGDLRVEVENARIYGGDHFRVGGTDGTRAGDHLARWGLNRNFVPL